MQVESTEKYLSDLKTEHVEGHLCVCCRHRAVCKVHAATDEVLQVTIVRCTAFEAKGKSDLM